jgi:hypothetical protein
MLPFGEKINRKGGRPSLAFSANFTDTVIGAFRSAFMLGGHAFVESNTKQRTLVIFFIFLFCEQTFVCSTLQLLFNVFTRFS